MKRNVIDFSYGTSQALSLQLQNKRFPRALIVSPSAQRITQFLLKAGNLRYAQVLETPISSTHGSSTRTANQVTYLACSQVHIRHFSLLYFTGFTIPFQPPEAFYTQGVSVFSVSYDRHTMVDTSFLYKCDDVGWGICTNCKR